MKYYFVQYQSVREAEKTCEILLLMTAVSSPTPVNPDNDLRCWTLLKRKQLEVVHTSLFPRRSIQTHSIFSQLEHQVRYQPAHLARVRVFGRWHPLPRQQAGYGDCGVSYTYSSVTLPAEPWTPILAELRDMVEKVSGVRYNFVIVNRYATGDHFVGQHRDSDPALDPTAPIASLSFGATRDLRFKYCGAVCTTDEESENTTAVNVALEDGMLLLMKPPTNEFWYHSIPIRKKCKEVRISLTFRRLKKTCLSHAGISGDVGSDCGKEGASDCGVLTTS